MNVTKIINKISQLCLQFELATLRHGDTIHFLYSMNWVQQVKAGRVLTTSTRPTSNRREKEIRGLPFARARGNNAMLIPWSRGQWNTPPRTKFPRPYMHSP